MVTVERIWPESVVVCVASGPSLTASDVAYVRGKARVIAINDTVTWAPWADILYSSHRSWWKKNGKDFAGLRYSVGELVGGTEGIPKRPDVQVLKNTGETGLERDRYGVRTGRNSGYAAINLAVHLGAKRIVLLGYNMSRFEGRSHFEGVPYSGNSPYPEFVKCFRTIVQPLRDAGVEIVNCTPGSALTMFPVTALREVIEETAVAA